MKVGTTTAKEFTVALVTKEHRRWKNSILVPFNYFKLNSLHDLEIVPTKAPCQVAQYYINNVQKTTETFTFV